MSSRWSTLPFALGGLDSAVLQARTADSRCRGVPPGTAFMLGAMLAKNVPQWPELSWIRAVSLPTTPAMPTLLRHPPSHRLWRQRLLKEASDRKILLAYLQNTRRPQNCIRVFMYHEFSWRLCSLQGRSRSSAGKRSCWDVSSVLPGRSFGRCFDQS